MNVFFLISHGTRHPEYRFNITISGEIICNVIGFFIPLSAFLLVYYSKCLIYLLVTLTTYYLISFINTLTHVCIILYKCTTACLIGSPLVFQCLCSQPAVLILRIVKRNRTLPKLNLILSLFLLVFLYCIYPGNH